jgi:hypothetical protein
MRLLRLLSPTATTLRFSVGGTTFTMAGSLSVMNCDVNLVIIIVKQTNTIYNYYPII